jgi:4-amino-4-deoxy-L-arabinose transferase-like glycosyltransferase
MARRFLFLVLLLMVAGVYLYTATGPAILDDGDALYSHISQQMVRSGDWITPYANGVRFLDKPPVLFWVTALAFHIFGFTEFAARLPAALAVLGISLVLFSMGKRAGGSAAGFIASTASALCIGTFLFTRMVFPDVLFVFFLTFSLFAFLKWYLDPNGPLLPALLFYVAMAGAVLTKGLMGLFFPGAIIFLFLIWAKDWHRLRHFHLWKGSLIFLVLALPWHILAAIRNPGFLWYYFVNEQFLRFFGKRLPLDYETISLPIFWALVLAWLFPWSAFLPVIRRTVRISHIQQTDTRSVIRMCVCWTFVIFVFFSLSSRIEHYSMPIFPPLALLIGLVLSPESPFATEAKRSVARGFAFLGILGGIIMLLLLAALVWMGDLFTGQSLSHVATARLHAYQYYFAPLFEMPPDILDQLKTPLIGTCCVFAIGLTCAWWMNRRGRRLTAVILLNLVMVGFCYFTYQSLGVCEVILSSRQFGQKLNQLYRPGDMTVVLGDYETANSINFYAPGILRVYKGSAALLQWGLRYPDAPEVMLTQSRLNERWKGTQRIFLLTPEGEVSALGFHQAYPIMRSGGRILLCNQNAY